jgi:hypothetical protein
VNQNGNGYEYEMYYRKLGMVVDLLPGDLFAEQEASSSQACTARASPEEERDALMSRPD